MKKYYCYKLKLYNQKERRNLYYIGMTGNTHNRENTHRTQIRNRKHPNPIINDLIKVDDVEVSFEILSTHKTKEEALQEEIRLILENVKDPDCANIEVGGDTLTFHPFKKKRIAIISKSIQMRYDRMSREEKVRLHGKPGKSNPMYGKTHSKKSRKKISEKLTEHYKHNPSKLIGIKRSDETKKKMSIIASKRMGKLNPFYGRSHTKETKEKIARVHRGKVPVNARRIIVNGVIYQSVTEAGRQLNTHTTTVLHRCNSKNIKFKDWKFL